MVAPYSCFLLQEEMDYLALMDQMGALAHQVQPVHQVSEDLLVYQVTQQKENQDFAEQMEDLVLSDSICSAKSWFSFC